MADSTLDRRDFHRLTAAAISGLATGIAGCSPRGGGTKAPETVAARTGDVHLCRGLNDCKQLGKDGKNDCRGQGSCATAKEHTCGGQNDCKGLGGCGDTVGANDCKGQGGCHVPLMTDAWDKLRKRKEADWQAKKLDFGAAPVAAAESSKSG
jgi:hypothetical protein